MSVWTLSHPALGRARSVAVVTLAVAVGLLACPAPVRVGAQVSNCIPRSEFDKLVALDQAMTDLAGRWDEFTPKGWRRQVRGLKSLKGDFIRAFPAAFGGSWGKIYIELSELDGLIDFARALTKGSDPRSNVKDALKLMRREIRRLGFTLPNAPSAVAGQLDGMDRDVDRLIEGYPDRIGNAELRQRLGDLIDAKYELIMLLPDIYGTTALAMYLGLSAIDAYLDESLQHAEDKAKALGGLGKAINEKQQLENILSTRICPKQDN